jgi:hypothetical protein
MKTLPQIRSKAGRRVPLVPGAPTRMVSARPRVPSREEGAFSKIHPIGSVGGQRTTRTSLFSTRADAGFVGGDRSRPGFESRTMGPFEPEELDRLVVEADADLDALLAEADAYQRGLERELAFEEQRVERARRDAAADLLGAVGGTPDGIPNAPFDVEIAALKEGEPEFRRVPVFGDHDDRR